MSTDTIRTQPRASSDAVSGNSARQGVVFAESEVLRAQKHVAAVQLHYGRQLESAESWLRETQRRLRCAQMVARRSAPEPAGEPVDPSPWLPAIAPSSLLDWQRKVTLDVNRILDD
jgi:hypothetical protein